MTWLLRFLHRLVGRPCVLGCGQHVHPDDLERHLFVEHADGT